MDELQAQLLLEDATKGRVAESWDANTEHEMVTYGEKCLGYHWIHNESSNYYNYLNSSLSLSTIVISGITTAATATNMNPGGNGASGDRLMVTFAVLTFLSACGTVLASILRFVRAGEKSEKHLTTARLFQRMASEIKLEMSFKTEDRTHAKEFLEKICTEYSQILSESPSPPPHIVTSFKEKIIDTNRDDIAIPEIANGYFRTFKHLASVTI